jgi:hypothetical protein
MTFCMTSTQSEKEQEKKERIEKQFWAEQRRTTIHAPLKEKEDTKTNKMMRMTHNYYN